MRCTGFDRCSQRRGRAARSVESCYRHGRYIAVRHPFMTCSCSCCCFSLAQNVPASLSSPSPILRPCACCRQHSMNLRHSGAWPRRTLRSALSQSQCCLLVPVPLTCVSFRCTPQSSAKQSSVSCFAWCGRRMSSNTDHCAAHTACHCKQHADADVCPCAGPAVWRRCPDDTARVQWQRLEPA